MTDHLLAERRRTGILATSAVMAALLALIVSVLPVAAQAPTPPPPPVINAVKPAVASPGDEIKISGHGFIEVKAVTMAGLSLKHKVKSRRRIVAEAPPNAVRGTIVVVTRGGTAASPRVVVVRPSVQVSRSQSPAGSTVFVSGQGFIPGEPVDLFYGRTGVAGATADHGGKLQDTAFMIPAKAVPGLSFVRVQGRFSGVPIDIPHEVTAVWPQRGFGAAGTRRNHTDAYLGLTVSPSLIMDWTADTIGPARSSPAVTGGMVYAGADTGALLVVPTDCATDGRSCSPRALGVTGGAVGSSPAILDVMVFVGSEDGNLYAFDRLCPVEEMPCDPVWIGETSGPITSSPAVDGDVVVVGSTDGDVYAFDVACEAADGVCSPRWVGHTGGPIHSSPAIHDGVTYVGSDDGYVHAFDTACGLDGAACVPLWRGWTGGVVRSSPAVANGLVYVGSADSKVHGFAVGCADDGSVCQAIWRGAADAPIESSPVVADGLVVVGAMGGSVMAFPVACADRATGCAPTWTAVTGGPVRSSPAVSGAAPGGPMVFVGSDDGFLYGYPLKCRAVGKPPRCPAVWASGTSAPISASPAIVDGAVYASSEDGTVRRWSLPQS